MQGVDTLVVDFSLLLALLSITAANVKHVQVAVIVSHDDDIAVCRAVHGRKLSLLTAHNDLEVACGGVQTSQGAVVAASVKLGGPAAASPSA